MTTLRQDAVPPLRQDAAAPVPPAAPLRGERMSPKTHRAQLTSAAPTGRFPRGRSWLIDAKRFPISKTITGAVFEIERGGMRQLHWHPNADEWQYVISGRASVTMFARRLGEGAGGRRRWPRATWATFRRDMGTPSRTSATRPCASWSRSTQETIRKSTLGPWMAGNPADVLATNFGKPPATFRNFPAKEAFVE